MNNNIDTTTTCISVFCDQKPVLFLDDLDMQINLSSESGSSMGGMGPIQTVTIKCASEPHLVAVRTILTQEDPNACLIMVSGHMSFLRLYFRLMSLAPEVVPVDGGFQLEFSCSDNRIYFTRKQHSPDEIAACLAKSLKERK